MAHYRSHRIAVVLWCDSEICHTVLKKLPHCWQPKSNLDCPPLRIPLLPTCRAFSGPCLCSHGPVAWNSLPLLYKLNSLGSLTNCLLLPKFQDSHSQPEMSSSPSCSSQSLADILLHIWSPPWPTVITPLLNSFITQVDIPIEGRTNGPTGPSSLECLAVRYLRLKWIAIWFIHQSIVWLANTSLCPTLLLSKSDFWIWKAEDQTLDLRGSQSPPEQSVSLLKGLWNAKSVSSGTGLQVTNLELKSNLNYQVSWCACMCVMVSIFN